MLFNSLGFLLFFPVVALLYFALPHHLRRFWLLVSSAFFYMTFIPYYILFLFPAILASYWAGIAIADNPACARKILWLTAGSIVVMGTLFIFKYYDFVAVNLNMLLQQFGTGSNLHLLKLALPLGISFHSFQAVSYMVDVSKGQKPERDLSVYSLFILFFPQLVAGPIERADHMIPQFRERHHFSYKNATAGLKLMLWGMFKKVVVADRLAVYVDQVFTHPGDYHGGAIALAIGFFAFQIYCDFSGYTDIALGSARFMGFRLSENFNRPYAAGSVGQFWTRWNMTLYSWFRDYIYIPLGGSHVSNAKLARNIFIVFALSGLWHGANWTFVIWGLLNAFFIVMGYALKPLRSKLPRLPLQSIINMVVTFLLICTSWVFFRAPDLHAAMNIFRDLAMPTGDSLHRLKHLVSTHDFTVCFLAILLFETIQYFVSRDGIGNLLLSRPTWQRWCFFYAMLFIVVFMGNFENRTFIYFQF